MSIQWTTLAQSLVLVGKTQGHAAWQPAADLYRVPGGWLVKFELAGVRPEDIQLAVDGRGLTLSGLRHDCLCHAAHRPHFMEITYNRFARSIEFPDEIDQAELSTEYRDGMLIVRLNFKDRE